MQNKLNKEPNEHREPALAFDSSNSRCSSNRDPAVLLRYSLKTYSSASLVWNGDVDSAAACVLYYVCHFFTIYSRRQLFFTQSSSIQQPLDPISTLDLCPTFDPPFNPLRGFHGERNLDTHFRRHPTVNAADPPVNPRNMYIRVQGYEPSQQPLLAALWLTVFHSRLNRRRR